MKLNDLRNINNKKIKEIENKLEILNEEEGLQKRLKKHLLISEILEDEACFFKMPTDVALNLLKELINKNKLQETYISLINSESYTDLKKTFKL